MTDRRAAGPVPPGSSLSPEPVTIVALTIVVEPGGGLDTLLESGRSWRYGGQDWRPVDSGADKRDRKVWRLEQAPASWN